MRLQEGHLGGLSLSFLAVGSSHLGTRSKLTERLCVFAECVVTFCTSEEECGAFVAASGLHLPVVSKVVSAFWTGFFGGWQSPYLMFLTNHSYRFPVTTFHFLRNRWPSCFRFLVATFWAHHLNNLIFTLRN
jgi:hypothetical protein